MNINCYLFYSHFLLAYPLEDFRAKRVCEIALVQGIRFQSFSWLDFFIFFYLAVTFLINFMSCPHRFVKMQTRSENTRQYYIPKSLISYLLSNSLFFPAKSFCSFLIGLEEQNGWRSAACAANLLNRVFYSTNNQLHNIAIYMWYI